MTMRRENTERQAGLWIDAAVVSGPRHVFYDKLNQLLASVDFDRRVEDLCEKYYRQGGRPSIPPGRYFRMLLVGYFVQLLTDVRRETSTRSGASAGGSRTRCRCSGLSGWT